MRILLTAALAIGLTGCATMKDKSTPDTMKTVETCEPRGFVVFFDTGSATLDPTAIVELDRVGAAYRLCDVYRMEIQGFADSVGSSAANQALSDRRATAVLDALTARGVLANRARIIPFGEATIGDSGSPDGFERRVVVQLMP